jgi:hypothetical protein
MPFVLFMDESGDHNLVGIDRNFPIFCLAGCVFEREYYKEIVRQKVDEFKLRFWGRTDVILVSRKIRKHQENFSFLDDEQKRAEFYEAVNALISSLSFTIITVVILKQSHLDHYGSSALNPYSLSLEFIMERYSMLMTSKGSQEEGYMMAESRGKNEDDLLKEVYQQLRTNGTRYQRLANITSFWMEKKETNIAGLQVADLAAYPIAAKIFRPMQENKAFEVLFPKIYAAPKRKDGSILGYGLKVFPQPTFEHYVLFGNKKESEP